MKFRKQTQSAYEELRPTQRVADLAVRVSSQAESRRDDFFRFVSWFSRQAANAHR